MDETDPIPQTLCVVREVNVYGIQPRRPGTSGHYSGEWRVSSRMFTGRLKVNVEGNRLA